MVAVVALFAVTSMPASQQASAVHHKVHTASSQVSTTVAVHHKAHIASKGKISVHQVAEVHGKILNATALKKLVKGPFGESDVIGGMMSGGYQ
jgi:hypothetical protein